MIDDIKYLFRIIVIMFLMILPIVFLFVKDDLRQEEIAEVELTETTEKVSEIVTEEVTEVRIEDATGKYFSGEQLRYKSKYATNNQLSPDNGVVYFRGHVEVWYSVKEKLGYTTTEQIPSKHVADDGTIRDADGYICIAAKDYPIGYCLMTSLGPGKVYDSWETNQTIGIYTDWEER